MKKILFAASEAVPFIKTGGLADVTGSLPKYFDRKKYDVRIILPKYLCMDERFKGQLHFKCHFYVNLSWRRFSKAIDNIRGNDVFSCLDGGFGMQEYGGAGGFKGVSR